MQFTYTEFIGSPADHDAYGLLVLSVGLGIFCQDYSFALRVR